MSNGHILSTKSERFVDWLCNKSFLSLWSFPNPKKANGEELCDYLVAIDKYILIFSVRESNFREDIEYSLACSRWNRTIDHAVRQAWVAEQRLNRMSHIIKNNGEKGFALPEVSERKVFRICVAFGAYNKLTKRMAVKHDKRNDFVHLFDEDGITTALDELDTVSDFVRYLSDREKLLKRASYISCPSECDLLALYLNNDYSFSLIPDNCNAFTIEENSWKDFVSSEKYQEMKREKAKSLAWDRLISRHADSVVAGTSIVKQIGINADIIPISPEVSIVEYFEHALSKMALEDRVFRIALAEKMREVLAPENKIRARCMYFKNTGICYIFLATLPEESLEEINNEILGRLLISLARTPNSRISVCLAFNPPKEGESNYMAYLTYARRDEFEEDKLTKLADDLSAKLDLWRNRPTSYTSFNREKGLYT